MRGAAFLLIPWIVLACSGGDAAASALLRGNVMVEGDTVTVGDLFDNAGEKSDIVVAHAPAPGHRMTVDADWLLGVARRNDLDWRPEDSFVQAVIRREGVTIAREQIEAAIVQALKAAGADPDAQIGWENKPLRLVVAVGGSTQIGVHDLVYDAPNQHFSAVIDYNDGSGSSSNARLLVSGRLYTTVELPTAGRTIAKGEIITAQDIGWVRVRQSAMRRDVVADADQIIGMTPRQTLRANQLISATEIQRPIAVARGATVTMTLRYGGMQLSAQGRAIDQGSVGDVIHLTNTHSNMTVEGVIDAPNHVAINLNGTLALAN